MSIPAWQVWALIIGLSVGTYLIRLSFLGLIGGRDLPEWVLRHLRYTPVAVLPGMVAPLVLWPEAVAGAADPPRLIAASATVLAGVLTRSMMASMAIGIGVLVLAMGLFGQAG